MQNYDFKQCRAICKELEEKLGVYNWREVIEELQAGSDDFEVAGYRFIDYDSIDKIQQEELASDEYVLGCFTPWFLSSVLDMPAESIEAIQKTSPEALGQIIIAQNKLAELQADYARCDGYGHHFAHYDGNEYEIDSCKFFAFRVN